MENRLTEIMRLRSIRKLPAKLDHAVVEHFQTLHLDFRAREPVQHCTVPKLRFEQFVKKQTQHLFISHHAAARFYFTCVGRIKKLANYNRLRGDAAHLSDVIGIRSFARTWSTTKQDKLFWET